jgi:hypothetical protein
LSSTGEEEAAEGGGEEVEEEEASSEEEGGEEPERRKGTKAAVVSCPLCNKAVGGSWVVRLMSQGLTFLCLLMSS